MDTTNNSDDTLLQPAPSLVDNTDLLPHGRALDVAMGNGRNAIYLAKIGFEVEGIDISRDAIEAALARALEDGKPVSLVLSIEKGQIR